MFYLKPKIILFALMLLLCLPYGANCAASDIPIDIKVNGYYIKCDVSPFLASNTTFVPIRFVSQALGADEVEWDGDDRLATITDGSTTISLPVGKSYGYVNGKKISIGEGIRLVSGRTFVPVRLVSELLGGAVGWDGKYYTVNISKSNTTIAAALIDKSHYDNDQIFWLARIIEAESSGEPMKGKVAVGNVILNRVASPDFPDTIYGVIFDDVGGIQFEPVLNGKIFNTPSSDSIIAAKMALNGVNYAGSSMFFLNPAIAESSWIPSSRTFYTKIDNHEFYL